MSWRAARKARRSLRSNQIEFTNPLGMSTEPLPETIKDLLNLFDAENIVIGNGEIVLGHSEGIKI